MLCLVRLYPAAAVSGTILLFLIKPFMNYLTDRDSVGGTAANSYDRRVGHGKGRGRPAGLRGREIGRSVNKTRVWLIHSTKMFVTTYKPYGFTTRRPRLTCLLLILHLMK